MSDWLFTPWQIVTGAVVLVLDLLAFCHVILYKRDVRAAIGWVGLIWFVPGGGPVLYYLFGINRVVRKAKRLKRHRPRHIPAADDDRRHRPADLPSPAQHLAPLDRLVHTLTGEDLLTGNAVRTLHTGAETYGEMLAAIDDAKHTIGLATYIFDRGTVGQRFIDALGRAARRGVDVRVLIDDVGARYSWPRSVVRPLRAAGVRVARFLPQLWPWHFAYANLRCHRKLLVADGTVGFTGGMNIRDGHDATLNPRHPIVDMHARLDGPVVDHLRRTFADDWEFCTGRPVRGDRWFPPLTAAGSIAARGVRGGPDEPYERIKAVCLGGLAAARESVRIVSPYFLPDTVLVGGLDVAGLRGVHVDVVLPALNNLRLVHWACAGQLAQVLDHGWRVWLAPPPFVHTKLMIVDRAWVLLGSSNWDARSFRLNFEFDVECYDPVLAGGLDDRVRETIGKCRLLTKADLDRRSWPVKLRDGASRLLSPYL
jgi:cardiolipin synthase